MAKKRQSPQEKIANANRRASVARAELKAMKNLIDKGWKPKE